MVWPTTLGVDTLATHWWPLIRRLGASTSGWKYVLPCGSFELVRPMVSPTASWGSLGAMSSVASLSGKGRRVALLRMQGRHLSPVWVCGSLVRMCAAAW